MLSLEMKRNTNGPPTTQSQTSIRRALEDNLSNKEELTFEDDDDDENNKPSYITLLDK
jgi:hypothetical protein